MKRYIEIVYDNSGSMDNRIGNKKKYEIAQDLFEKEILPTIGLRGDEVVLRLLRNGCAQGTSMAVSLPNHRHSMLQSIKGILHDNNTPLFYTVLDAIEACRKVQADEHLIFVLTDGDDTCGVSIEKLIDVETIKKYVRNYKVLLVQLAVNSPLSRNNLTAFTNALGGQTIGLDSVDSFPQMRTKLRSALNVSGFSNKFPLEHCFNTLPGADKPWEEIEEAGIDFHQAMLLYHKGLLPWMPDFSVVVTALQFAELHFLFSLLFKSALPEDLLKTMLSQLKKPYYYSFDCIYWDFASARWRYFIQQNKIEQLPNEEAKYEDNPKQSLESEMKGNPSLYAADIPENLKESKLDSNETLYSENKIYRVELAPTLMPSFQLLPDDKVTEGIKKKKPKILKDGDRVIFKWR
jgi:hypothetical protein